MKKILNYLYWVVLIGMGSLAILTALTVISLPVSAKLFLVQSGSMEPAIQRGSVILIQPQNNYQKDDVITYKNHLNIDLKAKGATTTHRVVEEQDGYFITKGDANENNDTDPVDQDLVVGKVLFAVPWVGYVIDFAKTQLGLVLLIVVPATLIVYSEVLNLRREVATLIDKRKQKKAEKPAKKKKND